MRLAYSASMTCIAANGRNAAERTIMKRLHTPTGLFPTVAAAVLSIVAVVALAFVELDAPARVYQLDAVIQVASSFGGVDG
jgi:hypothetical protein